MVGGILAPVFEWSAEERFEALQQAAARKPEPPLPGSLEHAVETARDYWDAEELLLCREQAALAIEQRLLAIPEIGIAIRVASEEDGPRLAETLKRYKPRFEAFRKWAAQRGFNVMPIPPGVVGLYLFERFQRGFAVQTIAFDSSAIAFMHKNQRYADPTADALPKIIMRYIRTHAVKANQQPPADPTPVIQED